MTQIVMTSKSCAYRLTHGNNIFFIPFQEKETETRSQELSPYPMKQFDDFTTLEKYGNVFHPVFQVLANAKGATSIFYLVPSTGMECIEL